MLKRLADDVTGEAEQEWAKQIADTLAKDAGRDTPNAEDEEWARLLNDPAIRKHAEREARARRQIGAMFQAEKPPSAARDDLSPIVGPSDSGSLQALEAEVDRTTKIMAQAAEFLRSRDSEQQVQPNPSADREPKGPDKPNPQRALLALAVSSTVGAAALNVLNQKYGASIPDWVILLAGYVAAAFWLYWAWHTKKANRARAWLYTTYPRMFLAILVIVGAITGAAAGAGLWLVNRHEQRLKTANQDPKVAAVTAISPSPSLSPPSPSPSTTGRVSATVTPTPSLTLSAIATPTPVVAATLRPPDPLPSPSVGPSIGPYFGSFMSRLKPLHKGYKTYNILSPAGIGTCDFYTRLGTLENSTQVHVALYIRQTYCSGEILGKVANDFQDIVTDLKMQARNDDLHMLGLHVQPVVYVYTDDNIVPLRTAASRIRSSIGFYIDR